MKSMHFMKHALWIIAKMRPKKNVVALLNHSFQYANQVILFLRSVIGQKFLNVHQPVAQISIGKAVPVAHLESMVNVCVMTVLFCSMENVLLKINVAAYYRVVSQYRMDGKNCQAIVSRNAHVKIMNIFADRIIAISQAINAC